LDRFDPGVTLYVKALEDEIEILRSALERPGKTETEYALKRGQIKGLRQAIEAAIPTGDPDEPTS
jgi:hypothetical protein